MEPEPEPEPGPQPQPEPELSVGDALRNRGEDRSPGSGFRGSGFPGSFRLSPAVMEGLSLPGSTADDAAEDVMQQIVPHPPEQVVGRPRRVTGRLGTLHRVTSEMGLMSKDKSDDLFLSTQLMLHGVEMERQECNLTGYISAMWRCPDLEQERMERSYYSPEYVASGGLTVKEGLANRDAHPHYVQKSLGHDKKPRFYVTGFDLDRKGNVVDNVLPFNPTQLFEFRRIAAFQHLSTSYYYYPMEENRATDDTPAADRSGDDPSYKKWAGLLKMFTTFTVTLTQRLNSGDYPFDRQIVEIVR